MLSKVRNVILLASIACAAVLPINRHGDGDLTPRAAGTLASTILAEIVPASISCASTATACRTSVQAAPYLIQAFQTYGIYNFNEMAGIIALIAYESGGFVYDTNQQGTAGQGTRNMQMVNWNWLYATSISALKTQAEAIVTSAAAASAATTAQKNAIRALVLPDEYSWASGAWFYSTQCGAAAKAALQAGGTAGWTAYMACVGVDPTEAQRLAYYTAAQKAFGLL